MAIDYDVCSSVGSFDIIAGKGEGLNVILYGSKYNGSTWPADPSSALTDINEAFDGVEGLEFEAAGIQNVLNSVGAATLFYTKNARFRNEKYLSTNDVTTLKSLTAVQLGIGGAGSNVTYSDLVVGSSKSDD